MKSFDSNDTGDSNYYHHCYIATESHTVPLIFINWFFYHHKIDLTDYFYYNRYYVVVNGWNEVHAAIFNNGGFSDALLLVQILFLMDLQNNDGAVCDSYGVEFFHLLFIVYLHSYWFFYINLTFNFNLQLFLLLLYFIQSLYHY